MTDEQQLREMKQITIELTDDQWREIEDFLKELRKNVKDMEEN